MSEPTKLVKQAATKIAVDAAGNRTLTLGDGTVVIQPIAERKAFLAIRLKDAAATLAAIQAEIDMLPLAAKAELLATR